MLLTAAISAVFQVLVLTGVPFGVYILYHRWRYKRRLGEVAARAGLRFGEPRYLVYSLVLAIAVALVLIIWPPPIEPLTRPGSAQRQFVGLGLGADSIVLALLYGVVKTGFTEELLFRGLIAGSLSRRLSFVWANLFQALIFLLPHFAILFVAREVSGILPIVFVGALVFGWVRIRSGSILGSWLMHAAGNVTMALVVAART